MSGCQSHRSGTAQILHRLRTFSKSRGQDHALQPSNWWLMGRCCGINYRIISTFFHDQITLSLGKVLVGTLLELINVGSLRLNPTENLNRKGSIRQSTAF